MDYRLLRERSRLVYDAAYCERYRRSDDLEVRSDNHRGLCAMLAEITRSFGRGITVLDLGCGSGRYFHCLENVERIVGVDLAFHLLRHARDPVLKGEIRTRNIDLVCADLFELEIRPASCDFVYSIGVLGEHCPFDLGLCERIHGWLKPGGKALLTAVDVYSKMPLMSWKRRAAEAILPLLPASARLRLRQRLATYYLTGRELERILERSPFSEYRIRRRVSTAPEWIGAHYECLVSKST